MKRTPLYLLFVACFLSALPLMAQNDTATTAYKPVAADCDKAIPLRIFGRISYGPTLPPRGFGEQQEIVSQSKNSNIAFEKEHHSAWYLLTMAFNGELIFDVALQDSSNDYDFILYAYTGPDFCTQLQQNTARVVRSNIRRNDIRNKGITGMAINAVNELQAQGPGAQFSKSLPVKWGQQYMLVLDNVYDGGKGHTLNVLLVKKVMIGGVVTDDQGKKVKARITLSDPKGLVVATAQSDDSGVYSFPAHIAENTNYQLTLSEENSFFATETINTYRDSMTLLHIQSVLPRLSSGKKYVIGNINFPSNSPAIYPSSYPSLEALCDLMKRHKEMVIRIEGHVNLPPLLDSTDGFGQKLSDERARAVYDYLVACGVEAERMSTIGHSNRFLLYPLAETPQQQAANRRVEINVISMNRDEKNKHRLLLLAIY